MKIVRLSALSTGRLYPSGNIPDTHFIYRPSRSQGHSAAGKIMSLKNSNYSIGNTNSDFPACNAMSQSTAPPRVPIFILISSTLRQKTRYIFE